MFGDLSLPITANTATLEKQMKIIGGAIVEIGDSVSEIGHSIKNAADALQAIRGVDEGDE